MIKDIYWNIVLSLKNKKKIFKDLKRNQLLELINKINNKENLIKLPDDSILPNVNSIQEIEIYQSDIKWQELVYDHDSLIRTFGDAIGGSSYLEDSKREWVLDQKLKQCECYTEYFLSNEFNSRLDNYKNIEIYDLAIITANETEYQSILKFVSNLTDLPPSDHKLLFKSGKIKLNSTEIRVILNKLPDMGGIAMTLAVTKLIDLFNPKIITTIGIAAGNKKIAKLGDILVCETSLDYNTHVSINKEGEEKQKDTSKHLHLDNELKSNIDHFNLKKESFLKKIKESFPQKDLFKDNLGVHVGKIISGNQLLRNDEMMQKLIETYTKLIGLDMETYALLYASQNNKKSPPLVLSIKSVSDFGGDGFDKNDPSPAVRSQYAAHTSASYLIEFLNFYIK